MSTNHQAAETDGSDLVGDLPVDTRGVLIERIVPTAGRRGGHRERVDYVRPDKLYARLRALNPGRYRVACIGPGGCIKGAACVMAARGDGSSPEVVPPRAPSDYQRAPRAPKKRKLRAKLKTTQEKLKASTHQKVALRRMVKRRDGQLTQEREACIRREKTLRAELRAAQHEARDAAGERAAAISYAESQERVSLRAQREAEEAARGRAAAEAELTRLRAELDEARRARGEEPAGPPRPQPARVVEVALGSAGAPASKDTPRAALDQARGPASEVAQLRAELGAARTQFNDLCALREREHVQMREVFAKLDAAARRALAERDAAVKESGRYKATLHALMWSAGGVAAMTLLPRMLDLFDQLSRGGLTGQSAAEPISDQGATGSGKVSSVSGRVVVPYRGSAEARDEWSGAPFALRGRAGGSTQSSPSSPP